jgi:preprotein translocase subunit SecA
MLDFITKGITKVFGTKSGRDLKEMMPLVNEINESYATLRNLTDDELRAQTTELQEFINNYLQEIDNNIAELHSQVGEDNNLDIDAKEDVFDQIDELEKQRNEQLEEVLMEVLPRAFAVVKETARRLKENGQLVVQKQYMDEEYAQRHPQGAVTFEGDKAIWSKKWLAAGTEVVWDMLHYDVQLIGGIVLHKGRIAEMATGEGKTLVATLPAYLNALAKRGVHIVTVNDYLAKRDSEWMAPLMEFHGLRVDCIDKYQPHSEGRVKAYQSAITYGTNNEFGFDYLRDNMARNKDEKVQIQYHYAMIDEVDSVLIDDARTPLIISGPIEKTDDEAYYENLNPTVQRLVTEQKRLVGELLNEAKKKISAGDTDEGGLALFRAYRGLPKNKPLIKFRSETGNQIILQKTENIYLEENQKRMPEADEPLLFTIDEQNNQVELTERGIAKLTDTLKFKNKEGEDVSDENFFVLPDIAIELDAIDKDETLEEHDKLEKKDVILKDYSSKSQRIHAVSQLLKAYALFEKDVDYIIRDSKVMIVDEQTARVMEGRRFSDGLHQALEAKEHVKIEDATQTYATVTLQNYFRMYHKLAGMTGTAETEAGEFWEIYKLDVTVIPTNRPIARNDMQDKVYKTVREKYNAVADEVQNLVSQNRPVLVGTTSVENSEILSRMLKMKGIEHQVLNAKQHAKEADVVALAGFAGTVTVATNMAGRGTDIKLSKESKDAGGLAIISTERHESRRVDRQLRGRAGRQGDPGSSQFFVSLEDNLMRMFGSDRIAKYMDKAGVDEGEVIQHSLITKSIERAQKKVEENNFAIRKRLLEYDDVMNAQREVIYKRRDNALDGERLELDLMNNFYGVCQDIIENTYGDFEGFKLSLFQTFGMDSPFEEAIFSKEKPEKLANTLYDKVYENYETKNDNLLTNVVNPVVKQVYEQNKAQADNVNIPVPFSDGSKQLTIGVNLAKAHDSEGKFAIKKMEQAISLAIIDQNWKEHLRDMDDLKQQVQNASFEQKDPLLIYKHEAFELFKVFFKDVNGEVVSFLGKAGVVVENPSEVKATRQQQQRKTQKYNEQKSESRSLLSGGDAQKQAGEAASQAEVEITKPIRSQKVHGRNDKVTVRYPDGTTKKGVKYKSVAQDIEQNRCVLVD